MVNQADVAMHGLYCLGEVLHLPKARMVHLLGHLILKNLHHNKLNVGLATTQNHQHADTVEILKAGIQVKTFNTIFIL